MSAHYGATGPIAQYNSLQDRHLEHFFQNRRIRHNLLKAGLITHSGRIVDEETYRQQLADYEQQQRERELIAKVHLEKTLDMERQRKLEIRRRVEEYTKLEIVRRVKGSRELSRSMPLMGPTSCFQPTATYEEDEMDSVDGVSEEKASQTEDDMAVTLSAVDNSALYHIKGNTQVTYYHDNRMPPVRHPVSPYQNAYPQSVFLNPPERGIERWLQRIDRSRPVSRTGHHTATTSFRARTVRQRSAPPGYSRRTAVPSTLESRSASNMFSMSEAILFKRSQKHSLAEVKLIFLGRALSLGGPVNNKQPCEVVVLQQHCGGNTVCLYKDYLKPKDHFTIVSRRHRGSPFALTIYVDGMQDVRLSVCCEYKHQPGKILGGKNGHFGLVSVQGAAPCCKCQMAREQSNASKPEELEPRPPVDSITSLLREYNAAAIDNTRREEESLAVARREEKHEEPLLVVSSAASGAEDDSDQQSLHEMTNIDATTPAEGKTSSAVESQSSADEVGDKKEEPYSEDDFEEDGEEAEGNEQEEEVANAESAAVESKTDTKEELESGLPSLSLDSSDSSTSDEEGENSQSFYSDNQSVASSISLPDHEESNHSDESSQEEEGEKEEGDSGRKMSADDLFNSGRFDDALSGNRSPSDVSAPKSSLVNQCSQESVQEGKEELDGSGQKPNAPEDTTGDLPERPLSGSDAEKGDVTIRNEQVVDETKPNEEGINEDSQQKTSLSSPPTSPKSTSSSEKPPSSPSLSEKQSDVSGDKALPDEAAKGDEKDSSEVISEKTSKEDFAITSTEEQPTDLKGDEVAAKGKPTMEPVVEKPENSSDATPQDKPPQPELEGEVEGESPLLRDQPAEDTSPENVDEKSLEESTAESSPNHRANHSSPTIPKIQLNSLGSLQEEETVVPETSVGVRPSRSTIDISSIAQQSKGKEMELQSIDLSTEQLGQLATVVADNKELSSLVLRNTALDDNKAAVVTEALEKCPGPIKMLNLSLNQLGPKGAEHIASAVRSKGSNLNFLLMHGNPIGDEGLKSIVSAVLRIDKATKSDTSSEKDQEETLQGKASNPDCPTAGQVREKEKSGQTDEAGKEAPLTVLHLGDCQLTDASAGSIANLLHHCPTIEELDLSANRFTTAGLEVIGDALQTSKSLRSLSLEFCGIGDEGMEMLARGLQKNKSVQTLDLDSTGLSDKGAEYLISILAENKTLQSINLSHNSISARCWQDIKTTLRKRVRRKSMVF